MKKIYNWRNATTFDVEADGLLNEATLIHVLSLHMVGGNSRSLKGSLRERLIGFFNYHMDNEIPVVAHNGICYDIPLCEKLLGMDLSRLMVIDTLALSWYLNTDRSRHGLDSFFDDYGIAKVKVSEEEWEGLTPEEREILEWCENE